MQRPTTFSSSFFFNDTATTEIYTLSLHDALPISVPKARAEALKQQIEQSGRPVTPELERSEEHTSELQSHLNLVCRLLLEKKKWNRRQIHCRPTLPRPWPRPYQATLVTPLTAPQT